MHQGKVPLPYCISTLGLLGALSSSLTSQRGAPRPVTPQVHPDGATPTGSPSKFVVCAGTALDMIEVNAAINISFIRKTPFALSTVGHQRMHRQAEQRRADHDKRLRDLLEPPQNSDRHERDRSG